MALLQVESETCHGCGGWLPETTSEDASWVADPPYRCHKCAVVKAQQKEYDDQKPESLVIFPAHRREKAP